eukprot:8650982-Alexandrium_andersonii.AAC.1
MPSQRLPHEGLRAQESQSFPAPAMAGYFGDRRQQASNLGALGVHLEEYDGNSDLMKECRRDIIEASRRLQEHTAQAEFWRNRVT